MARKDTRLLKMKSNQDGGAYAANNPAAPAKELMNNQSKVAKYGCRLKQVSDGSKIAKMGNPYSSNINQEAEAIKAFPVIPFTERSITPPKPQGVSKQQVARLISPPITTMTPPTPAPEPKKEQKLVKKEKKVRKKLFKKKSKKSQN